MSLKPFEIESLIDWLGPEGAVAGLDRGHHTNAELMMLARENGVLVDSKTARRQIAIELVMTRLKRIDKNVEQLLEMTRDEVVRYLGDRMVSRSEMSNLMEELEIAPKGKIRGKYIDFVANEISDLGMYQRVASGQKKT